MYVEDVEDGLYGFYATLLHSTVTHLTYVEDAKYYCILYTGPLAPTGGRLFI